MRVAQAWLLAIGAGCVGASLGSAATWYLLKDDVAATPVAVTSPVPGERPAEGGRARSSFEAATPAEPDATTVDAAAADDAPVSSAPATDAEEASARALQARDVQRAHAVLDSAIARHEWTEADGAALREVFGTLPARDRDALLSRFAVAVNRGVLVPRTERIPF